MVRLSKIFLKDMNDKAFQEREWGDSCNVRTTKPFRFQVHSLIGCGKNAEKFWRTPKFMRYLDGTHVIIEQDVV